MSNPKPSIAWPKGVSGNPAGRPKKDESLTGILAKIAKLKDVKTADGKAILRKEALARKLFELALKGDLGAIRYIYDRIDGRPLQSLEHSGSLASPTLNVILETETVGDNGT